MTAASPCIDAGLRVALEIDCQGNQRRVDDPLTPDLDAGIGPAIDLGAYEYGASPPCDSDLDGDGTVCFVDLVQILATGGSSP